MEVNNHSKDVGQKPALNHGYLMDVDTDKAETRRDTMRGTVLHGLQEQRMETLSMILSLEGE